MERFEKERWPATRTSTIGRPMSARARCASSCPSTCSPPIPVFGQTSSSPRASRRATRLQAGTAGLSAREFVGTDAFVKPLDLGPPVGRPVQYRVSGPDIQKVRDLAQQLAGVIVDQPASGDIVFDWNEPARVVKVDVLQDKARQLGVTSEDIATRSNGIVGGSTITQVRDDIYLINVIGRARAAERGSIETLQNLQLPTANGKVGAARRRRELPLRARAADGLAPRQRIPTITVKAAVLDATQPATVVDQLEAEGRRIHRKAAGRVHGRQSAARSRKAPRRRGRSPPSCR